MRLAPPAEIARSTERIRMRPSKTSASEFLNVDLDLTAQSGFDDLVRFLEPRAFVLNRVDGFVSLELNGTDRLSLEQTILRFIELVRSMPQRERNLWDDCDHRTMNIAIQVGLQPQQAYFALSANAVSLLADAQCEIVVTVYAPS